MITLESFVANGETSTELVAIKLKRETLHPGVISTFIAESTPVLVYVRGQFFHVYVVTKAGSEAFMKHLHSFKPEDLTFYLKQLRKSFGNPNSTKQQEGAVDLVMEAQSVLGGGNTALFDPKAVLSSVAAIFDPIVPTVTEPPAIEEDPKPKTS